MGRLDENGRFRLTYYETGDGAIVGAHRIAVLAHGVVGGTKVKWHAPLDYATSGLTEEITEPTDSLIIILTWNRRKHQGESAAKK